MPGATVMKVFLAGATGVVGRRLAVLLRRAGHEVAGTTRSEAKAAALQAIGAVPVLVDAYDADKLKLAVFAVQPDVIVHQLTDLPQVIDPNTLPAALEANARLRITGTRNLVDAALTNGVRRVIAQSIAFAYAPGQERDNGPLTEDHPLDPAQAGVIALEDKVLRNARHRRRRAALWPLLWPGHMDRNSQRDRPRCMSMRRRRRPCSR